MGGSLEIGHFIRFSMFKFHFFGDLMVAKFKFLEEEFGLFLIGGVLGHFLSNFLLYFLEGFNIILGNNTDGYTGITDSGSSAYSMDVTFGVAQVIVDDHLHQVDIKSSCSDFGTYENAHLIFFELFQSNDSLYLTHIAMQTLNFFTHLLQQHGNPLTPELRLRKYNHLLASIFMQQVQQVAVLEL